MSDTPRTDYYTKRLRSFCDDEYVPIEFARNLERELTAVTEERDELKSKYRTHHDEAERITNEIRRVSSVCRELREQRDRLAEALRDIADCDFVITLPDRMDAVRAIAREALGDINWHKQ